MEEDRKRNSTLQKQNTNKQTSERQEQPNIQTTLIPHTYDTPFQSSLFHN